MTQLSGKARVGGIAWLSAIAIAIVAATAGASHAQLATTPWPMFHHDLTHSGLSPYDTSGNNGTKKWAFATESLIERSAPAIGADGTVYIGSGDQHLYAVNANGTLKWAFPASGDLESSPAIAADGTIYFASIDGDLYAVNANGTQKWVLSFGSSGSSLESSPTIGPDGTIYLGISGPNTGFLFAVADTTCSGSPCGTAKWGFGTAFGRVASSPAIGADGTIYFGSATDLLSGDLYALNPDGTEKWEFTASGVDSSPAIGADGTIYFGDNGGTLYAVTDTICNEILCGKQKWAFGTRDRIISSPAIGADGTIYFGSANNTVYALTDGGSGIVTSKWSFIAGPPNSAAEFTSSPAVSGDGTVYFGSADNNLYALNPDGTEKWAFTTGAFVQSSPAIGPDGTVYIGSADTNLYAIGGPPTTISVPASLAFGNSPVGDTVTKNITVRNTGKINPLLIGSVSSNDPEFAATGATTCPSGGLAPGQTCTIAIRFTPGALGARSATLSVNDNTPTSPQHVALSGTGTIDMTVTPASFMFTSTKIGSTKVKAITVHNFQTNAVALTLPPAFSGSNPGDFSATGGTCTSSIPAKSTCTLFVTYAPSQLGTESATMTVTDSPDTLGPYTVSFTTAENISATVAPTVLAYGTLTAKTPSKTKTVTVTNLSSSSLSVSESFTGSNAGDFAVTGGTCGATAPANSSCTILVTFTPTASPSPESARVAVTISSDPTSPHNIALTGTGP
jgi:outer membrane protein assembly factor BamB